MVTPTATEWAASVVDAAHTHCDSIAKLALAEDLAGRVYGTLEPGDTRTLVYRIGELVTAAARFVPARER